MSLFGHGVIKRDKQGNPRYEGSIPKTHPDEIVYVIRESDLEQLSNGSLAMLFRKKVPMPKDIYELRPVEGLEGYMLRQMPDTIEVDQDGRKATLILDRHWFTDNPLEYLLARWQSVEESLREEHEG